MDEAISLRYEALPSKDQNTIRDEYVSFLIEMGYVRHVAENTDDGRDEFVKDSYDNR